MNKTITMNLSGMIFHIEEDAYERLNKYLATIKGYFMNSEGKDEIMNDIESRIAEMLQEKVSQTKQAVLMADVESVISQMGKPEDFAGDNPQTESTQENPYEKVNTNTGRRRRVFRDTDDKVLGGVCSGVANYFDFDPIWLRGAFAISFFVFGSGLLVYIILWIIMPEAKTTAEKLEMRGEKVDVNNIGKAVSEEFEDLKKRMKDFGDGIDTKNTTERVKRSTSRAGDFIGDVLRNIFAILGKIFSVAFIIFGLIFLIILLATLFGKNLIHVNNNDTAFSFNIYDMMSSTFPEGLSIELMVTGLVLFFGLPLLSLIYSGIRYLFGIKQKNKIVSYTSSILWLTGLVILIYGVFRITDDFSQDASNKERIALVNPHSDTLYLSAPKISTYGYNDDDVYDSRIRIDNWTLLSNGGKTSSFGYPTLDIVYTDSDSIELVAIKSASGPNKKEAAYRANHISYNIIQKDSLLEFDPQFQIEGDNKWRDQGVKLVLKVPRNKVVFIGASMKYIIYDVDNVTNTFDHDMVNRRWLMTKDGLQCIDCDGLDDYRDQHPHHPVPPVSPDAPEDPSEI
ncbi:MAG: PspC domain-containing protein [Bacteroidota bacterium]|nr:PspC domain-containing protein [Bacteroidota bacterium]